MLPEEAKRCIRDNSADHDHWLRATETIMRSEVPTATDLSCCLKRAKETGMEALAIELAKRIISDDSADVAECWFAAYAITSTTSSLDDLVFCLTRRETREIAALELYQRTKRPWTIESFVHDHDDWAAYVKPLCK